MGIEPLDALEGATYATPEQHLQDDRCNKLSE